MDVAGALKQIAAVGTESAEGRAALAALPRTAACIQLLLDATQNAWIADQRTPAGTLARDLARRMVELVPDFADGYRLLGFAHLSRGEPREAYLALSAMKAAPNAGNFDNFRALARHLMTGLTPVSFDLGGQRYTFELTTHNAAAIEAGAFHSIGLLTEWEELQFLGAHLGQPKRIAEVGVLVGNHTAYFLKAFAPTHVTLIDADPANVPFIRANVGHNLDPLAAPEVTLHTAFVGAKAASDVPFAGVTVPQKPLRDLVQGPVDFLKIDVDGGELGLLEGAASVIETYRPSIMIETTPATHDPVVAWFTARRYTLLRVFDRGGYRNVVLTPT